MSAAPTYAVALTGAHLGLGYFSSGLTLAQAKRDRACALRLGYSCAVVLEVKS